MMKSKMMAKGGMPKKSNFLDEEQVIQSIMREGAKEAEKEYKETADVQDSITNPLVRGARKAATYVTEKYGDIRDDVRTAVTGDESAKYRGMTRKIREGHLGYSKGGSVTRADGAAKRGKTKGRTV